MNIALDIGHAKGTGARGNGLEEHAVASSIAHHLFYALRTQGHTVHVLDFPDKGNQEDLTSTIRVLMPMGTTSASASIVTVPTIQRPMVPMFASTPALFRGAVWPPVLPNLWQTFCRDEPIRFKPAGAGHPQADAHAMGIVRMRVYQ